MMRRMTEIKIVLGIAPDKEPNVEELHPWMILSSDLSNIFHSQSFCFWYYSMDSNLTITQLIKAACYEDYRFNIDYFILCDQPNTLDTQFIHSIITEAEFNNKSIIRHIRPRSILLVRSDKIRTIGKLISGGCFELLNYGTYCDKVENALQRFGQTIHQFDNSNANSNITASSLLQPFHLPQDVHYFPTVTHPGTRPTTPDTIKLTQQICTILSVLENIKSKQSIALYGAGSIAKAVFPFLKERISLVVDRAPEQYNGRFYGIEICSLECISSRLDVFDTILITPAGRESQIRFDLQQFLGVDYKGKTIISFDSDTSNIEHESENIRIPPLPLTCNIPIIQLSGNNPSKNLDKTIERTLTTRAVLYVGYPCNIKCIFCYYTYHQNAQWHSIEECKRDATLYKEVYANNQVDITGGEPTVYPNIQEIVEHCSDIGLRPTLITNTLALSNLEKLKKLQDGGVYDFLCSIHALGETYDFIVDRKGAWDKVIKAISNFGKVNMKWRANCTMTKINMHQFRQIAEFVYLNGARVINFINYNPFYEWSAKMDIDFQACHEEIEPYLREALEFCDDVGLEANVRYYPLCFMKGHEDKAYNYSQLSYDHHEWDFCSWYSDVTQNPATKMNSFYTSLENDKHKLHLFLAQRTKAYGFAKSNVCNECSCRFICDGVTNQYFNRFGDSKLNPYKIQPIIDHLYFIKNQKKVIDQ
jgi:MoaA/NifB/PqqE/SkfB family radical SAM enzyme